MSQAVKSFGIHTQKLELKNAHQTTLGNFRRVVDQKGWWFP